MNLHNYRKGVSLALIALSIVFIVACKKDTKKGASQYAPVVNINGAHAASSTSITVVGGIQSGYPITEQGIFWSTVPEWPTKHLMPVAGNPINGFEGTIQNLSPGTNYYVGVYAKNSAGTTYLYYSSLITTPQ